MLVIAVLFFHVNCIYLARYGTRGVPPKRSYRLTHSARIVVRCTPLKTSKEFQRFLQHNEDTMGGGSLRPISCIKWNCMYVEFFFSFEDTVLKNVILSSCLLHFQEKKRKPKRPCIFCGIFTSHHISSTHIHLSFL